MSITREIYEGFQRAEFERWDAVIAPDVLLNSPGNFGSVGRDALKTWAAEFLNALAPRIDLVDEYEGDGHRAFLTVMLNWKHIKPFFGLQPTGREGTSIETFLLTLENGQVTRFDVTDNTLDLALYFWDRGWPQAHNVRPQHVLVKGRERL